MAGAETWAGPTAANTVTVLNMTAKNIAATLRRRLLVCAYMVETPCFVSMLVVATIA
jgi:hypothetical protein